MNAFEQKAKQRTAERIRIAQQGGDVQAYLRDQRNATITGLAKAETQGKDYATAHKAIETPALDAAVGNTPDFVAPSQTKTNDEQALEIMGLLNPVDFSPEAVAEREWKNAGVKNAEEYREALPGIVQKDVNDLKYFFEEGALLAAESGLENTVSSVAEAGRGIWDYLSNSYKYGETKDSEDRKDVVSPFLLGFADEHAQASQDAMDIAKSNVNGTVGEVLLDATAAGSQMVGDIVISGATGGSTKIPMALRSFGAGVQRARQKGYDLNQQMALGLSSAAIEYVTEKFFGGNPFYDKAEAGLVNQFIAKVSNNQDLLKFLASTPVETLNEGLEEILSGVLNPVMEKIITGQRDPIVLEELLKEGLIGVMLGGAGQVASAAFSPKPQTQTEQTPTEENAEPESPLIVQQEQKVESVAQTEEPQESPLIIQQEQKTGLTPGTRPHAEAVLASPELRAQFEQESGVQLKGTKAEQRNAVLAYYRSPNQGTAAEVAEPVSPLIVQQEQPVAESFSPLIVEDTPAPQELPADGMEAQADTFGHSVGAATPSYGPQVPTQSKPVTESSWMSEEAKRIAQPGTHERISEARSLGLAEAMFAVDEHGNVVNAADVAEDLLSMEDGTWSGVDSDGAMMAAQELWKQGDEAGFNKIMDRYNREGTHEGQAMQARKKWVHTPAGKVAKAKDIIASAASDGRNKAKAKQAEAEIAEVKKAIEEAVPEAANVAVSEEAYDIVYEIVKQAEKPRPRKGDDRHWTAQLADILAARVDVKGPSHRTKSLTQQMLDDLLRLTKDAAPKHTGGVAPQNSAKHTETFQNYLQNRAHYEQAVSWAQKAVFEKYSDSPEMLSAFEEWLNNGISLRNTLNGVIKEHGVDINIILRKSWDDKAAAVNQIKDNILANTDLTDAQKAEAAEIIHGRFWQEVAERSRSVVERFANPQKTETTKKTAKQNLEEMVNLGAFEMDDLGDKVVERIVNQTARENTQRINDILAKDGATKESAVNQIADILLAGVDMTVEQSSDLRQRVVNKLNQEIETRNAKAVAKYVEPSKGRTPTTQMERFVAMYNRGAFDSGALREAVYKKMGLPVLTAKDTRQIYSLMEQAQQLRETDPRQADNLEQTANKIIASKVPVSFRNKTIRLLMDNMLGNFRTLITRNAGGNLVFSVPESVSQVPTAVVDALVSLKTKERYYAMPDVEQAKAYGKGFAKGVTETIEDFKWDVHTPRSGETLDYTAQIQPFSNWACKYFDKMVQTGLEIGDRPFYEGKYNARMAELNKLRDMNALPEKLMQNFDALAPVEARLSALEAVFQSEGKMAKGLTAIKGGVQDIMEAATGIGLGGQFSVPFTRTPGNVLQRTLEYLPGISTVKNAIATGKEIARGEFDQRRFSRETGRNITGAGIAYLAAQAVKAGLVTGGGDDRPDEELLDQSGWQEYSVKIGDKYLSYDWIPILGPVMAGTADFINTMGTEGENPLLRATKAGLQATAEMSALSGLGRLFGGYSGVVGGFGDTLLGGTSQVVPSLVRQAARATDDYERSTYDPNKLKQQWNYIKSGIPGLRQTLPTQYDLFGNPIEISDGRGAGAKWFENLVSPSYVSEEKSDPRTDEMLRLRDEGYNVPVPEITKSRDIDGNGVNDKLTADELSAFTHSRNSTFGELATAFIGSEAYEGMSNETKSLLLSEAMDFASKMATAELYKGRGEEYALDKWMVDAAESSDPARYIQAYRTFTIASNDKHRDYKALDGLMELYGQLPESDRATLDDSSSELRRLYEASQEDVSSEAWYKTHDAISAAEKANGDVNLKNYEKLETVLNTSSGNATDVLLKQNLSGLLPEKYDMAKEAGFSAQYFVDAYRVLNTVKGDGTSGSKKRNFIAALVAIDKDWKNFAEDMYDLLQNTNTDEMGSWKWSWEK